MAEQTPSSPEADALAPDDGPECETCGKTTCPDADLPGFSEPRHCLYAPIYHALRDAKDCDYGCARDYTNQAVRLWVVEAVEKIAREQMAQAWDEGLRFGQQHWATNYAGVYENGSPLRAAPNPYRVSSTGQQSGEETR